MKNILFPTDFSDNSWNALVYILKLYAQNEVVFHLLHSTCIESDMVAGCSNLSGIYAEEELLKFKKYAEDANANANHSFNILLSSESLSIALTDAVKKYNIDLVVMGTKGVTLSKNGILNSITLQMIHQMKLCPILVIPETYDFTDINEIAFVTDFNEPFIEKDIYPLKNLENNSKIRVVYFAHTKELNAIQQFYKSQLENLLSDYDYSFHRLREHSNKVREINSFIKTYNINIIVFVNSKFHLVNETTKKSLINDIGNQPKVPFLVIQE